MAFNPCLFLNLSCKLSEDSNYDDESKYRTSISRAYYAAFLVTRTYLESKGYNYNYDPLKQERENVHSKVFHDLKKRNPHISNILFKLRQNRNNADYDLNKQIKKGITISSLKSAEMIIETISKL